MHPNQNWACDVHYIKIINTLKKKQNKTKHIWNQLTQKLKYGIKTSIGYAVLELLIKMCKILFWSITQKLLGPLKCSCHLYVFQTICFRMLISFFKGVDNFDTVYKTCSILVWGSLPPKKHDKCNRECIFRGVRAIAHYCSSKAMFEWFLAFLIDAHSLYIKGWSSIPNFTFFPKPLDFFFHIQRELLCNNLQITLRNIIYLGKKAILCCWEFIIAGK